MSEASVIIFLIISYVRMDYYDSSFYILDIDKDFIIPQVVY